MQYAHIEPLNGHIYPGDRCHLYGGMIHTASEYDEHAWGRVATQAVHPRPGDHVKQKYIADMGDPTQLC